MLTELINPDHIISYNSVLAHKIGLHETLYLTELCKQMAYTQSCYIVPDTTLIERHTTFSKTEQKKLLSTLIDMGLVIYNKTNAVYKVDTSVLAGLFTTKDKEVVASFDKVKKSAKKEDKSKYILRSIKSKINPDYPYIIKEALIEWLEAIQARFGFVNATMLTAAMNILNPIIQSDVKKAEEIIKICTVNGYKEMQWGINKYNTLQKLDVSSTVSTTVHMNNAVADLSDDFF